jgi:class 3 adenylate cyclase
MPELPQTTDEAVRTAEVALARGAWSVAFETLAVADKAHRLTDPAALAMLAQSAYLAGAMSAAGQAFERLHTGALAAGDPERAADAAVQIAFMQYDALIYAPSKAWLRRAEKLLADRPDSPVWAPLTTLRGWHRLSEGDYGEAIALARDGLGRAERSGDSDTIAVSKVLEGRGLIADGAVDEGLAILDESAVAAVSGELTPIATGVVFCMTNCAFQSVSDYDRAEEWTKAMETWSASAGVTSFQGRCRLHRAQLKRLHGDWHGAAADATRAQEELASVVPAESGWAMSELGLIRLRLGDLAGAEASFLEAQGVGWEPEPGLSLLRLAQGDVPAAVAAIGDALDRAETIASREVPPHGALRRAPLLAAQAEISIAAGELATARADADELDKVAAVYRTRALKATAAGVRAAVDLAAGDLAAASRGFQTALTTWQALDAPFEVARARMGLAQAARASGNEEKAKVEYRAANAAFERLEAVLDARRASAGAAALAAAGSGGSGTQRQVRTFMFTDIVKSTDLLAAIGDEAWQHVLRWHNETLRDLISKHRGVVVNSAGDGYFAAFATATDAMDAAIAIQRALLDHRQTAGFAPRVRIGLHAAEADTDGSTWTGMGVHETARIGALAEGDEILVSRETAAAADEGHPSRLALSEPRSVTLKGLTGPVEVVSIGWR